MSLYDNNEYQTLLYALLRVALNTSEEIPQEVSALSAFHYEDWIHLISVARQQTVLGLVYDALSSLSDILPLDIPNTIGSALMIETDAIVRNNKTVSLLAERVLNILKEHDLPAIVMKGPVVGAFYPHPDFRSPGDLDIYCPMGQPFRVLSLLQRNFDPNNNEKIHYIKADDSWHCKIYGVDIDLHRHYFDFEMQGMSYPTIPSPNATLLMLSSHILKHAIGPGVGLRQICDMAMAYKALSGQYDWTELHGVFQSHGLHKWDLLLCSFIKLRLGVAPQRRDFLDMDISPLEKIVFSGGNFGHFNPSRTLALSRNEKCRKKDTLSRFIGKMPFALKYAPKQYCNYISSLFKGNLK